MAAVLRASVLTAGACVAKRPQVRPPQGSRIAGRLPGTRAPPNRRALALLRRPHPPCRPPAWPPAPCAPRACTPPWCAPTTPPRRRCGRIWVQAGAGGGAARRRARAALPPASTLRSPTRLQILGPRPLRGRAPPTPWTSASSSSSRRTAPRCRPGTTSRCTPVSPLAARAAAAAAAGPSISPACLPACFCRVAAPTPALPSFAKWMPWLYCR